MARPVTLVAAFAIAAFANQSIAAESAEGLRRIGFLGPASPPVLLDAFRATLADLGHAEGKTFVIDTRWPEGDRLDRLTESAVALLDRKAEVIVAVGATAARAAKSATNDIPIVFGVVLDPVRAGLVANPERPGGNVTGFTIVDPQQPGKQIEILRQALPALSSVALLGDAGAEPALFEANETAARAQGLRTILLKVERSPNPDFATAIESAAKEGAGAIIVLSTPVTTPHRKRIVELATQQRLPTLAPRDHADAGGLITFGTSFAEPIRRAAAYVDKIFKGAKAGDLPVETVRQHELIVNLATARHIGVTVPDALLTRATRVIQ